MASIVELIKEIQKRPAMYISKNYISCLKAFLDGWYIRDSSNLADGDIMGHFQDWIENKYGVKTSHSWNDIILFYSQDEANALKVFFELFEEFLLHINSLNKILSDD